VGPADSTPAKRTPARFEQRKWHIVHIAPEPERRKSDSRSEINTYRIAQQQLDDVANSSISIPAIHDVLLQPKRELTVHFPG